MAFTADYVPKGVGGGGMKFRVSQFVSSPRGSNYFRPTPIKYSNELAFSLKRGEIMHLRDFTETWTPFMVS